MLAGLPSQCLNYKTLNETSRYYTKPKGSPECDGGLDGHKTSAQWRGTGWYRFTGAAGTMMATKKEVTTNRICGSLAAGHLDTNTHPNLAEGQSQEQKVCFYYSTQCQWSTTVNIQKCDGFYRLPSEEAG